MTPPPKRKPGRPRIDPTDRTISFSVKLPSKQYDEIYAQSRRTRETMNAWIRRTLKDKGI